QPLRGAESRWSSRRLASTRASSRLPASQCVSQFVSQLADRAIRPREFPNGIFAEYIAYERGGKMGYESRRSAVIWRATQGAPRSGGIHAGAARDTCGAL